MDELRADLEAISDHWDPRGRVYALSSLLAIVGDGNGPEDAADCARDHAVWLRGLGILGKRIPSAQTLRHLLRDRGSDLQAQLQPLVERLAAVYEVEKETEADEEPAAEPREAYAVDGKTNELTAVRQLLDDLELKGRVVTIDALGCQTDISRTLADAGGWYLLASRPIRPTCTTTCAATSPT